MEIPPVTYMTWAKRHRPVRYELTASGVPGAGLDDIGATVADVTLQTQGTYGDPSLIQAIARRYGFDPDGVVPVPGASSGIFMALAVAADRGGAAAVEEPVYEPVRRAAEFLDLTIIPLPRRPADGFALDPAALESAVRAGARCVALTNLHNPSAALIDRDAMTAVARACESAGATLTVDEVYLDFEHVCLGRPRWTAAALGDGVLAINSLTKVYGLSGLRIGWLLTSPRLARRARRLMDYLSVNNAAPSMSLARRAFDRIERLEARTRALYQAGAAVYRPWLSRQRRLRGYEDHGAIFTCLRLPAGVTAGALNNLLVREYATRVTPGEFFNLPDHVRLSIAHPPEDLAAALENISDAVERLSTNAGSRHHHAR